MSGVDIGERQIRKGAPNTIVKYVRHSPNNIRPRSKKPCRALRARQYPLVVADGGRVLGSSS